MTTEITGNNTIDGVILVVAGVFGILAAFGFFKVNSTPRADTPSGVQTAANLMLTMGGLFIVVGIACGVFFSDLSRFWRIAWISIASLVGMLWMWTAFRVGQGSNSARWVSIPFLFVAFPSLPVLGWITVPIVVYCLFIKKSSRQFFQNREEAPRLPYQSGLNLLRAENDKKVT